MERIQVQDRIENILEIRIEYKYRIGLKVYRRYGEIQVQDGIENILDMERIQVQDKIETIPDMERIQVQDRIETILEIWSEYKYRIGLKIY